MAQKVAGVHVDFTANAAKMLTELERSRKEILLLRKTVDRSANRITYAFNRLRRAAQVVASAFIFVAGIKQLLNLVSAMAKAEDQVKLMQARFQQFAREGDAFTKVYDLSKDLGVSMQEAAEGMTRLLVATKGIGTAQSELEQVYTNIVLLGRAGGTSAEEMKGAMRQLSQGLASGRLQGEELRSVLENLPLVAMEIADQMNIGIGQIRKAAKEGRITGDVVIDALTEVEVKMEDLPKTWAMQTENLRTEWQLFLAELSEAVDEAGLLQSLTDAVKWVRINMMGSFLGVSTEDLRAQRDEVGALVDSLRAGMLDITDPEAPSATSGLQGVPIWTFPLTEKGLGGQAAMLQEQEKLLRSINEELLVRANREKMAKDAAAARTAAGELAEEDKRIKQLQKQADRLRDSIKTDQDLFFELVASMDELVAKTDLTAAEAKEIIAQKYDEIMAKAKQATDEEKRLLDEIAEEAKETYEEMERFADQAAKNIQDAFAEFFFDPFEDGLKGMVLGFINAIRRMLAEAAALQLVQGLGIDKWIGSLIARADGGSVMAGQPYLVGERGPELFVPGASGNIIPNHAVKAAGGISIINNIDARGADEARIARIMPPLLEENRRQTIASIINMRNEGRL